MCVNVKKVRGYTKKIPKSTLCLYISCIFSKILYMLTYIRVCAYPRMALPNNTQLHNILTLPSLSYLVDSYALYEVREFQNYWSNLSDLYLGIVAVHKVKRANKPKIRLHGML